MQWNSKEVMDAKRDYFEMFPDSGWAKEGSGLTADEAIRLMRASIESGIDQLKPTYPEYDKDVIIA